MNSERDTYNWYGLPKISFTEPITNTIIEEQVYNYFELIGEFDFTDSYIDYGRIKGFYFTESFNSSEIFVKFDTKIAILVKCLVCVCFFLEKRKILKENKRTIIFYIKNCQKELFCFTFLCFFAFLTRGTLRNPIF